MNTYHALSAITHGAVSAIQGHKTREEMEKEILFLKEKLQQVEKENSELKKGKEQFKKEHCGCFIS